MAEAYTKMAALDAVSQIYLRAVVAVHKFEFNPFTLDPQKIRA